MVERARPVPCSVERTTVVSNFTRFYDDHYPVVQFTYEVDGEERTGYDPYPDGIHQNISRPERAVRTAERLEAEAGDTAYYDPETDQAFLVDDPKRGVGQGRILLLAGISTVVLGLVAVGILGGSGG